MCMYTSIHHATNALFRASYRLFFELCHELFGPEELFVSASVARLSGGMKIMT